jgi:vacuolar protein sorting-associated protein 13A/C
MCFTLYLILRLQSTAESKLADIKEKSATGLQYVIQQQSILDLNVDLQAPYIIVPHGGFYSGYVACFN